MFFFFPFLSVPWIHFYNSSLNHSSTTGGSKHVDVSGDVKASDQVVPADEASVTTVSDIMENMSEIHFSAKSRHKHGDGNYGSTLDHFKFFMTAPITKFYSGMVKYQLLSKLL